MMFNSHCPSVRLLVCTAFMLNAGLSAASAASPTGWPDCDTTCLVMSYELQDDTVACLDDLAAYTCASLTLVDTCTLAQTLAFHVIGSGADSVTTCNATTAYGDGPDGAVRLTGIAASGLAASDEFIETGEGLTLTQYANDVAILTGEVAAAGNPDQRFEVFIVYEDRVDGTDWTGGFKHANICTPPTDTWDIYIMKSDQSHLLGKGDFEGSLIQLQHAPSSQYFGFQIGEGANDHNCDYGAGGWFSWEGTICGSPAAGAFGDVIVDLACETDFDPCTAQSIAYFNAYVPDCGVIQHSIDILRIDDEAPEIAGVPDDITVICLPELPEPDGVTVTDNCPVPGFPTLEYLGVSEIETADGDCRTFAQTWRAEDECGNVAFESRLIHQQDFQPPVMVGLEVVIIECDEWPGGFEPPFEDLVDAGLIDVADNCTIDTVLIEYGVMSGGCHYDHIMTYTPIDECGNVGDSFMQIVVVDDLTPPVLVDVPADTSVSCTTTPDAVNAVPYAIDNCDPAVNMTFEVNYLDDGDGCDETYIIERIFIAEDCSYNHARDTQLVHVVDTAAPELTLTVPGDTTLYGCFGVVDVTSEVLGEATFAITDDCGDYTYNLDITDSEVDFVCTCTYGADTTAFNPCSLAPGDFRTQTQGGWGQDECSGDNPACYRDANFASAFPDGITVGCPSIGGSLTFTSSAAVAAFLPCGGPPAVETATMTDPACNHNVFAAQLLTAKLTLGFDQADAGFSSSPLGIELLSPDSGPLQTFTIQEIVDAADLVLGGCADGWFADLGYTMPNLVEALTNFNESFIDGTSASGEMRLPDCTSYITTDGKVCTGPEVGSGVFERTWTLTATDCVGNTAELAATQTVNVIDTVAPVLDVEPMVSLDCADWGDGFDAEEALALGFLTVSDDCGLDTVVVEVLGEASSGCAGAVEVRYTATDYCDNESEDTQVIVFVDTVAPVFTQLPADSALSCDGNPNPYVEGEALAEDACSDDVTITTSDELIIGDCAATAIWERTITATDFCGNARVHVQRFERQDLVPPVLTSVPADTTVDCALPAFDPATVTATDDCDATVDITAADDTITFVCAGTFTVERTITASDCAGNEDVHIQTINVVDTIAPELTIWATLIDVDCDVWVCDVDLLIGLGHVSVTDNCGDPELTAECFEVSGGCFLYGGRFTIDYTATDACGNTSEAGQIVTLIDNVPPVASITCPDDVTLYLDEDCESGLGAPDASAPWGAPTGSATDQCDDNVSLDYSYVDGSPDYACDGEGGDRTIMRTHTLVATDDCGNTDTVSCVQQIHLLDTIGPVVMLDPPMPQNLFECLADTDTSLIGLGALTATVEDACGGAVDVVITYADVVTQTCPGDDDTPEGNATLDRTFTVTATDCEGNITVATHTQTVNFFDVTAPSIVLGCAADTTLEADVDCMVNLDTALVGQPSVMTFDNCDTDVAYTVTYSDVETAGDCAGKRTIVRTFTVTAVDDCDLETIATCDQTIEVVDLTPPTLSVTCPDTLEVILDGDCSWSGGSGQPLVIVTDGCDASPDVTVTSVDHDTTMLCAGDDAVLEGSLSFIRTFTITAEDACGNTTSTSCDQLVSLLDQAAPVDHTLETLPTDTLFLDVECEVDLTPVVIPASSAEDGCDSDVAIDVTYTDDPAVYAALSDGVTLEIDTLSISEVPGATTYRIYAVLNNLGDCLSAVVGEGFDATWITSTQPFFQHPLGGVTPENIDPVLFGLYPNLEQDSWVTIGIDGPPNSALDQDGVQIVESSPWVADFEAGSSIALNSNFGDGWFSLPTSSNGTPGFDGRVLLAQLTTAGHLSGQLYLQVLEGGPGGPDQRYTLTFGNACTDEDGMQEGSYTFIRTWQSEAVDDCGNASSAATFQNIAVLDTLAPQFTYTCGLGNGEVITVPCAGENILDFDPLPEPCETEAVDECDTEVGIARFDDLHPDAPTDGVCNVCAPTDPAPFNGPLTCDGEAPESMRLYNFNGADQAAFTLVSTEVSRFAVGCDSSIAVTLHLEDGAGGGFLFEADYFGGWDWDTWNGDHPYVGVDGAYKKDCAAVYPGIPVWLDWNYFIMSSGTLTGTGTFAGSSFALNHQPHSGYFGFQVGPGANNKNEEYGASGWFFWQGELVVDGTSLGNAMSSGDIFVDLDCCLPWTVEHDYVAQDDCGNATTFEYTVTNTGETAPEGAGISGGQHQGGPVVIGGGLADKQTFNIMGLMPNPTSDLAQLQFEVFETQRVTVRLHAMTGEFLMELFDGVTSPGNAYQVNVGVSNLASGLYQLRVSGAAQSEVRKLLVAE